MTIASDDRTLLAGKYEIVREIGRGAVGIVYEARHVRLGRRVALKVPAPHFLDRELAHASFAREAYAMAAVDSAQVVSVIDVDVLDDGRPYLVMEYLEGRDLSSELRGEPPADPAELIEVLMQTCEGLAAVHAAGIVHRDIKPANLFISRCDGAPRVKITDFGISKLGEETALDALSNVGTPAYMAPEQLGAPASVDARTDLWAIGVIVFRALTGLLPFDGSEPRTMAWSILKHPPRNLAQLRPDLPRALVDVVARLLEKDPNDRYPCALSLRDALRSARPRRWADATVVLSRRLPNRQTAGFGAVLGLLFALAIPWVARGAAKAQPIPPARAEVILDETAAVDVPPLATLVPEVVLPTATVPPPQPKVTKPKPPSLRAAAPVAAPSVTVDATALPKLL